MPVPWTQIIQWVPPIIELSRDLLARSKRGAPVVPPASRIGADIPAATLEDLRLRVVALEDNERRQAELVTKMAEQQARVTEAVVDLHRRIRRLATIALVAAVVAVVAAVVSWR
jgi:hypothetical protein